MVGVLAIGSSLTQLDLSNNPLYAHGIKQTDQRRAEQSIIGCLPLLMDLLDCAVLRCCALWCARLARVSWAHPSGSKFLFSNN